MGWFDEQIKQRKLNDDEVLAATYSNLAGVILGKKVAAAIEDGSALAKGAIEEILKFYHIKAADIPEDIDSVNDQIEYLMRPYGIMRRPVRLERGWHKNAVGAMLGTRSDDGTVVALIPGKVSGYYIYDSKQGKKIRITNRNEHLIDEEAVVFYKPFPLKQLKLYDLMLYIGSTLNVSDFAWLIVSMILFTVVGMHFPEINKQLFGPVVSRGDYVMLIGLALAMFCLIVSQTLITAFKELLVSKINTKINISVEAATMMRILSLPADFFKDYSSGELSRYTVYINNLCDIMINVIVTGGLTSAFSLAYITQIFIYAPSLVAPAVLVIAISFVFSVMSSIIHMKYLRLQMKYSAKEAGLSYATITGIQKIKMAGAEKRAFAKWGNIFATAAKYQYNPPFIIKANAIIGTSITLIGTIVIYYSAAINNVSIDDYYAFYTVYGVVSSAFMSLAGVALAIAQIKPVLDMAKPIMNAVPEISEGKQVVTKLSGSIELNNISFRYSESMPNVLDDLTIKIKSGQYVAIVGKTGCGKSTLVRLLLGFERAQKGAVYYDGKDINSLDLKSLRRKIGAVMQNGKLFTGDIYSNIVISAPWLTVDDAWKAAEIAGIAEDIRQMPMGMNTLIMEGSGGISGGQKQRLMIARAVAPCPKILIFDEATSALDNITQKKVSEALDAMKCTRIVIAHRLSTIRQCDRIIVLDGGKIVEDGNYEELMAKDGFFAELVKRQMTE